MLDREAADEGRGSPARSGERTPCYWLNCRSFPDSPQRTIIMTGMARTGTSFVSSVFTRLGLPMGRSPSDKVSGHGEHIALRTALVDKDYAGLKAIIAEFDSQFDIWGWKAPAIRNDFDAIAEHVRNPCFVFVFKEPLSVAMRKMERGRNAELTRLFNRLFRAYMELVTFAQSSPHPCLLVSYDNATRRMSECIDAFARYAGIKDYDLAAIEQDVASDGDRYVRNLG